MDKFASPGALMTNTSAAGPAMLTPAFGFSFPDLYDSGALARLDAAFLDFVAGADGGLSEKLAAARREPAALAAKEESELLLALAPHLEDFIARLFGIEGEVRALQATTSLPPTRSSACSFSKSHAQVQGGGGGAFDGRHSSATSSDCWATLQWLASRGALPNGRKTEAGNAAGWNGVALRGVVAHSAAGKKAPSRRHSLQDARELDHSGSFGHRGEAWATPPSGSPTSIRRREGFS